MEQDRDQPSKANEIEVAAYSRRQRDAATAPGHIDAVVARAEQSAMSIRVAVAHDLQRAVGNMAVGRLLSPRRRPAQAHVQRQQAPATSANADYDTAVRDGKWTTVATLLDRLSDVEIAGRVAVGVLDDRQAGLLLAAVRGGPVRVRAALLDRGYRVAVGAGSWLAAAENLNGFDDAGIASRLAGGGGSPALTHDQLIWLYTAALNGMSGVSQSRILNPIVARDLDAGYQACVRTAHWSQAVVLLDRFPDAEITNRVAVLTPAAKAAMLPVCPASATRVRVALIGRPNRRYVVPFDRAPQSAPGERIIFRAEYDHATPAQFRLVFTGTGGAFDAVGGPASKTINGLESENVYFLINSGMTAATPTSVRLEVQLTDGTVVTTENWAFGVKGTAPTTMTQLETESDRPMPSTYTYQLGPDIGAPGQPDYLHQTILERFEPKSCNITVADLKPAYARANRLTSDAAITAHFFGTILRNGTFTIDNQDRVADFHTGRMPDKSVFEVALVTMKEITSDLPQVYEVQPGVPLARYILRSVLKVDGSKWLRKIRVP